MKNAGRFDSLQNLVFCNNPATFGAALQGYDGRLFTLEGIVMKKTIYALCTVAVLSLSAQMPAFAAAEDDAARAQKLEERFKAADKDGDGKLTKAEAEAGMPRLAKNFDRIDTDHKGYITLDQLKAAMATMAANGKK